MASNQTQLQKVSSVPEWLASQTTVEQFRNALPAHFTPARFQRLALTAFRQSPQLRNCDPACVMAAMMTAAQYGLEIGIQGKAYLVAYGKECTLIVGYRGLIELVLRSGAVRTIAAHVVYRSDDFSIAYHEAVPFVHIPNLERPDNDTVLGAYMHAVTSDGQHVIEWMTTAEINAIRNRSRAGKSGPWVSDWSEMARKTVVRRGVKYLAMSTEVADVLAAEDAQEFSRPAQTTPVAAAVASAPGTTHGASIPAPPPVSAPAQHSIELDFTTDEPSDNNGEEL